MEWLMAAIGGVTNVITSAFSFSLGKRQIDAQHDLEKNAQNNALLAGNTNVILGSSAGASNNSWILALFVVGVIALLVFRRK